MSMSDRDGKIWMDGQLVDWRDAGGDAVALSFEHGRLVRWTLQRAPQEAPPAAA
jgi:hypothetical protein